ncbi:hypothetical protein [Modestobacter sp. KNN46-3]|uniref:hypothetical protein n=1 Tax=Modestobacter sp. KNN46-3 TaxID=2711218 RepID=UPI0013DFDC2E|nr:hypothetical protein [Modestobacter sp. KNN46-3]
MVFLVMLVIAVAVVVLVMRAASAQDGGLGWPGEPGEGSGLGWPDRDGATHPPAAETTDSTITVAVAPAGGDQRPDRRRSGWRRWLGGSPAASSARSGSDAA